MSNFGMLSIRPSTTETFPRFAASPVDRTVEIGEQVVLAGAVTGITSSTTAFFYWYKDGVQKSFGQNAYSYTIQSAAPEDAGVYQMRIFTSGTGFIHSAPMTLTVAGPSRPQAGTFLPGTPADPVDGGPVEFDLADGKTWRWGGGEGSSTFARHDASGAVDATYDPDVTFLHINVAAVDASGNIYVGGWGTSTQAGAADRWSLLRLDENGVRDPTFNVGTGFDNGAGRVWAIEFLDDGRIFVGGSFKKYDNVDVYNHAILLPETGAIDPDFGGAGELGGGARVVYDVHLASDGTVLLAGSFSAFPGALHGALVKVDQFGNVVPEFHLPFGTNAGFIKTGSSATIYSVDDTLGSIIAVGDFTGFGGEEFKNIAAVRLDNGQIDRRYDFGTGFNANVIDLDLSVSGEIQVRGFFSQYDGSNTTGSVAALDGLAVDLVITKQPSPVMVDADVAVELSVDVFSTSMAHYNWRKGLEAAPGATDSPTYAVSNSTAADSGLYRCIVTNDTSEVSSLTVAVRVAGAPEFDEQPSGATVPIGSSLTLGTTVVGAGTVNFQWLFNGNELAGATDATLTLGSVGAANVGSYQLRAMNGLGTEYSRVVDVTLERVPFGVVDPNFDAGEGVDGEVYSFLPLANGDVLVGGSFSRYNTVSVDYLVLCQCLSDG